MPKIIGTSQVVVDDGAGLTIKELVGNVASNDDRISIAHVKVSQPASEPWLTLHYDEYICVLSGRMVLQHAKGELDVKAGQAVFIEKGERFKPTFPEGGTEYIPVCLPAFRPDRCVREDDSERSKQVADNLQKLHSGPSIVPDFHAPSCKINNGEVPDTLYHMCVKADWDAAKAKGEAYYPPTFEADGNYTHATAVAERLIQTANHFYQESVGDWICLRMSREALRKCGIITTDEPAMPVGNKDVSESWSEWICPHIYGGIPISVVDAEFPMIRKPLASGKGSEFLSIKYN